jgi:hypothetical protein
VARRTKTPQCGAPLPYGRPTARLDPHQALTLALLDHASDRYNFLVDSPKTAWGALSAPFALRQTLGSNAHLVHVVGDPRGVCWSNTAGNWKERAVIKNSTWRHFRTTLGWWAANLSSALFG